MNTLNPNRQFSNALKTFKRPKCRTIRAHIDRWIEHDEADTIWSKIAAACPSLTADDFIRQVVQLRAAACGLAAAKSVAKRDRKYVVAYHRKRIMRALDSTLPLHEIAAALEDAAFDLRHTTSLEEWPAIQGLPDDALSRKNQKGSQARRAFCLGVVEFLNEKSGKWMDAEVAALVDIALPQADATTIDQVRAMRRETTARGREASQIN